MSRAALWGTNCVFTPYQRYTLWWGWNVCFEDGSIVGGKLRLNWLLLLKKKKKCVLKFFQLVLKCRHKKEVPTKTKVGNIIFRAQLAIQSSCSTYGFLLVHIIVKNNILLFVRSAYNTHLNKRRWTMKTACNGGSGGGRSMAAAAFDGGAAGARRREGAAGRGRREDELRFTLSWSYLCVRDTKHQKTWERSNSRLNKKY